MSWGVELVHQMEQSGQNTYNPGNAIGGNIVGAGGT